MALVYNEITGEFEEVRNLPQIIEFKTQTQTIFEGENYLINWKVENASIIEINGERVESNIGQKEFMCDFTGRKYITLIARNGSEVINQRVQIVSLPKPTFNLSCSAPKIRKNTNERSTISWNIQNAVSAQILIDNNKEEISLSGNREFKPNAKTIIKFSATSLDQRTVFTDECTIEVFNASKVSFACNKKFSFASLPIVLSWETKDCLNVELIGHGTQPHNGSITLCPEETSEYILKVTDNFGTKNYSLLVQMLPLPLIRSVLVDAPKLEHIIPISYKTPQFITTTSIPTYENEFSKLDLPHIPDLKIPYIPNLNNCSEYCSHSTEQSRNRLSEKISKMLNHIFNK